MEHSDSGISAAAIIEPASSSSLETVAIFQPGLSKEAWLFLCAAFIMEALSWGMPLSYGVFQQYYGAHEIFNSNRENIAIVGSLALNGKVVLTGLLLPFIKPRIPVSSNLGISWSREIDFGFLRQPVFWFMETANIIQGAGYLIPIIFLPGV
ncbi:MAG: hypothetical protein LQ351_004980 [Letrouitia transgressa]|nr:MAG: hypothetical protein LQ351_004980 [Letrouitia transgressa]